MSRSLMVAGMGDECLPGRAAIWQDVMCNSGRADCWQDVMCKPGRAVGWPG